jgi:hypothetical protein
MMMLNLLPTGMSEMFLQVTTTGKLTIADRYGMMAALLSETPGIEDLRIIDRILRSLRRGRVQLVNEVSHQQ